MSAVPASTYTRCAGLARLESASTVPCFSKFCAAATSVLISGSGEPFMHGPVAVSCEFCGAIVRAHAASRQAANRKVHALALARPQPPAAAAAALTCAQ